MVTDATVCIPWRPQPQRLPAFYLVAEFWRSHGYTVVTGDSDHEVFNISAARNAAVRKATTEKIIVVDADTVPEIVAIQSALKRLEPYMVIYPFDWYRYIETVPADLSRISELPWLRQHRGSVGGLFVTTKTTYDSLGGSDERFRQWGYEDNAFHLAALTLGRVARLAGNVYAFGHDAERDMTKANPGRARIELYKFANQKPAIMRELVGV